MTVNAHFERYRLKLFPLSPIHVGSGTFVEPFEYDVDSHPELPQLLIYNLDQLLSHFQPRQRQEFDRLCGGDFYPLRVWLRKQFRTEDLRLRLALSGTAAQDLAQTLNDRNRTGVIELLPRNPLTEQAFIPGSAIKGAIRTAMLDAVVQMAPSGRQQQLSSLASEVRRERQPGKQNSLEQKFQATALEYAHRRNKYGSDLNYDPFRQLALSDAPIPAGETYIERMQIVKIGQTDQADPRGILMHRELTQSQVVYQNPEQFLVTELRLFPQLADAQWGECRLENRFTWSEIARCCHLFYRDRFQQEIQEHVRHPVVRARLQAAMEAIQPGECLIRLGRHSHFECVTIDSAYTSTPKRGAGKTRTFADGLVPLGWAKLAVEPWTDQP